MKCALTALSGHFLRFARPQHSSDPSEKGDSFGRGINYNDTFPHCLQALSDTGPQSTVPTDQPISAPSSSPLRRIHLQPRHGHLQRAPQPPAAAARSFNLGPEVRYLATLIFNIWGSYQGRMSSLKVLLSGCHILLSFFPVMTTCTCLWCRLARQRTLFRKLIWDKRCVLHRK